MPIYEFECSSCGHHLEAMLKVSEKPPQKCPKCENGKLKKVMSSTSFVLQGSGWYTTDYKKKSSEKKKLSDAQNCASGGCATPQACGLPT
jgi:putative FmdB family regulatory protein